MASKPEKWKQIQRDEPALADTLRALQSHGMTVESLHYEPTDGPVSSRRWSGVVEVSALGSVYLVEV